jgi:hypothetical protein
VKVHFLLNPSLKLMHSVLRSRNFNKTLWQLPTYCKKNLQKVDAMKRALDEAERPSAALSDKIFDAKAQLLSLDVKMRGNSAKNEIGERNPPLPDDGLFIGTVALGNTYGPTGNQKAALDRANNQLQEIKEELSVMVNGTIPSLESELKTAGAPWIESQGLIKN